MKHLAKSFMALASLHQRKYLVNHLKFYECKVLEIILLSGSSSTLFFLAKKFPV